MANGVATSVFWNVGGSAVNVLAGLIVAPFLLSRLGASAYGLWLLMAALSGYFSALDLGIGGSVSRNLTYHFAKGDMDRARRLFTSALTLMTGIALVAMLLIPGVMWLFFHLYKSDIPDARYDEVWWALLLICFTFAINFPLGLSGVILWAKERFDYQNMIDIPGVVARAGLSIYCISQEPNLVVLSVITLVTIAIPGIIKFVVAFRLVPELRIARPLLCRESVREIFDYGSWFFLLSLARTIHPLVSGTILGNKLGAAPVAPFRTGAQQLIVYSNTFLVNGSQALIPKAVALHANNRHDEQRQLFLAGGKICATLALFITVCFYFLGEPFLSIWTKDRLISAYPILIFLAIGELLPMSQWISYNIILGVGKHRLLAIYSLIEVVAIATLCLLLVGPFGIWGICLAVAVPGTLCRGLVTMTYSCRLHEVGVGRYMLHAFVPAFLWMLPTVAMMFALNLVHVPTTWLGLWLHGALAAAVFLGTAGGSLAGRERVGRVLQGVRTKLSARREMTNDVPVSSER